MSVPDNAVRLGRFGAWINPVYGDARRIEMVMEAERLGYETAWLGFGRASISDLALVARILEATSTVTVASAIVNMWTNEPVEVAKAYHRIADRHGARFLLGVGIGHPESIETYRRPYPTMVDYLDQLDAGGVPQDRRILAALSPRALRLAADRAMGAHTYLVIPEHTCSARALVGPRVVIAPEHKVVIGADSEMAREIGRKFLADPYFKLRNYTNNLRRYGYTDEDFADGGSDRLIDALVLNGSLDAIVAGLHAHLDAGADHVGVQVLTDRADPMPGYRRFAEALF